MELALGELEHALEDIGVCRMADEGETRVEDAWVSVDIIRGSMEALIAAHSAHQDPGECLDAAEVHEGEVDLQVESMEGHGAAWRDMGMDCGPEHDDGDDYLYE